MAGFECSSYLRRDGVRLDLLAATAHDVRAAEDYEMVAAHGMTCVRDGLVWHRTEPRAGCYDWSTFDRMVEAADRTGTRVMWDLLHFGWPDWTNPLQGGFVERFAELAARAAERSGPTSAFVPVNEISFLSWACGDDGFMHPHEQGRGLEVKYALCAAFIAAARAIRAANPQALIATAEPLVAVQPCGLDDWHGARQAHEAQYQAVDMILGHSASWLGGDATLVDVLGLNHYPHSQWLYPTREFPAAPVDLSTLIAECQQRYGLPMFISETGAEGDRRAPWFSYVMEEVKKAERLGADIVSTCLYPILNHLGWEDSRYCPNGLFCGVSSVRHVDRALADAIARFHDGSAGRRAIFA